jgi:hypothetical protein
MSPSASQRPHTLSLQQAAEASPSLSRLAALVRETGECLRIVEPVLPPGLRAAVKAGPLEEGTWCLLVSSNAVAAKLRQLLPALQEQLRRQGRHVTTIRIKVLTDRR